MTTRQNVADALADVDRQVELLKMTNPHINLRPLAESVAVAEGVLSELDDETEPQQEPTSESETAAILADPDALAAIAEAEAESTPEPQPEPATAPKPHKAAHHTTKKTAHKA